MKKNFIFFAFIFLVCQAAHATQPLTKSGGPAIDFRLSDVQGNQLSLNDYIGKKPVLLFFWTTWCPYCRQAFIRIQEEYAGLEKSGWQVLAVNVGESSARVNGYLKNTPASFNVLLDIDQDVARSYEIMGVPTYLVIDKNGMIVFRDNYFPEDRVR